MAKGAGDGLGTAFGTILNGCAYWWKVDLLSNRSTGLLGEEEGRKCLFNVRWGPGSSTRVPLIRQPAGGKRVLFAHLVGHDAEVRRYRLPLLNDGRWTIHCNDPHQSLEVCS